MHRRLLALLVFAAWAVGRAAGQDVDPTAKPRPATRQIPTSEHRGLAFDDRSRLLMLVGDHTSCVWDVTRGGFVADPILFSGAVALSPDGKWIAFGHAGADGGTVVTIRHATTGRPAGDVRPGTPVRSLGFSPDGTRMVVAGPASDAGVWDVATARRLAELTGARRVRYAGFAPRGRAVLTVGEDRTASVWDPATGRRTAGPLRCDVDVNSAAFGPEGTTLALPQGDAVALVRVPDGREIHRVQVGQLVSGVTVGPDGRTLCVCTGGRSRVHDATTGAALGPEIGSNSLLMFAEFDATGTRLVVAGQVDESGLWDWRTGEQVLKLPNPQWDSIPALAASPDGAWLAASFAGENHAKLLPVPTAR